MTDENKNFPGSVDSRGAQVPQPQQYPQGAYTAPAQNQQPYGQQAYQQQAYQYSVYAAQQASEAQSKANAKAAHKADSNMKAGLGKTFAAGFGGAALALVLGAGGFAGYSALTGGDGGSTTLGSTTSTVISASPDDSGDSSTLAEQVAQKCLPSIVSIDIYTKSSSSGSMNGFEMPGTNDDSTLTNTSLGSGVVISKDGYIITNNHVIDGADELEVTLNDNRKFPAKIIGADPTTDIALIKIEATDLPTIPFGDSEKLKVGEWVLAVGNPFNLTSTVTAGIVSAKSRGNIGAGGKDRSKIESFIQTDAAVNPGICAGALVNTKGELVGINTAIYSETGNFAGYSFAVPISIAGKVANDLKQFGTVQRAVLGVLIQDPQYVPDAEKEKVKVFEGAYVGGFAERSSAKEAGIEKGDVIVAVNGVKIKSSSALQEQISKYRPGDKVELTINRNGSTKKFTVELRNAQGSTKVVKGGDSAEVMGAAFKALNDEQKRKLGVSYGIEVTGLTSGKLKDAGIKKGFIIMIVNNQKISAPEDLEKIVESILQGRTEDQGLFIKGFYPNGRTKYYAIDLAE